jgi:hypothetical protein
MKNTNRIAILTLLISFSLGSWGQNIVYPWRATTAILKSGENFEVWFNASSGQTVNSIELKGIYNSVSTSMSILNGNWVYDPLSGNTYNMKITVSVPSDTPADRYDLVLNTPAGSVISYGGVKIVKEYKEDYYVIHTSDGHLYQSGYDTDVLLQRKSAMMDIANIMDVQVFIETGDNMYNVRNHPEREGYYFLGKSDLNTKGMSQTSAATFITPGDHEGLNANDFAQGTVQENADFVNDYWGLQNHNFKYGNGRFMNLNNAWAVSETNAGVHKYEIDDAIAWLHGPGSGGNFFLSAGHCYNKMHSFIDADTKLSVVLAGDKHHIYTSNPYSFTPGSPTTAFIAGSIINHFTFNLFQVNNTTGVYTTPTGSKGYTDVLFSGNQDIPSTWVPNLKLTYSSSNDGTNTVNTASIDNKFSFPISGAKVRFVMPKGYSYNITNGTKQQEFDGTQFHIVDVLTDLTANSIKDVYITSGAVIDLCPDDLNKTAPGLCGCGVPEGTCTINVSEITVVPATVKLHLNVTKQLTPNFTPLNVTNKTITWSTSDANVATVSTDGLVTAISGGTATITISSQDGGKTSTSTITVIPSNLIYQAEDAEFSGSLIATNQPGYNGDGFLDYTNPSNDFIKWTVYVPASGNYSLSFKYALATGSRPLKLTINGVQQIASIPFPTTGSFATWANYTTNQFLEAGNNTITLTAIGSSGGNFDELTITGNLGLNEIKLGQAVRFVHLSPNPLKNGTLRLSTDGFEDDTNIRVKITNTTGQKLYENTIIDTCHTDLNLTGQLTNGIYFVTVESDQTKITNKLIVN